MSENPFAAFTPKKEWLVCVDSDGCAMDTMDSKHHQAFCPQLIRVYGLEEYAGLITPHWMEVNLYSRTRGVNRFKGLAATQHADALFYPILVGKEKTSWERLVSEALPRFLAGTFAGAYQEQLLAEQREILK